MKNKQIITDDDDDIVLITSLKCGDMIEFVCDDLQDDFVKQPCYLYDYRLYPRAKDSLVFSYTYIKYIIKTATVLGIKIHKPLAAAANPLGYGSSYLYKYDSMLLFTDVGTFNSYVSRDTNLTATVKLIKSYEE